MGDWGKLAFYYDYEKEHRFKETPRVRGLISKTYQYPRVIGMILHAYYGIRYFFERDEDKRCDFDACNLEDDYSAWAELNTAFDVFFDYGAVANGGNSVKGVIKANKTADEDMQDYLFNCEGTYGWLYISYTGNLKEGNTLKYAYEYGYGYEDDVELGDLRRALEIELKHTQEPLGDEMKVKIEEAISFFEENAVLMTEEEFRKLESDGVEWLKEVR